MKVALIADYYPPYARGGSGQSVSLLASALAEQEGVEVHVLTPNYGGPDSHSDEGSCCVHRYRFPDALGPTGAIRYRYSQSPLSYARAAYRVAGLIASERPDVVAVQDYKFTAVGALLASQWLRNVPLILTLRDSSLVCPLGYCYMKEGTFKNRCSVVDLWRKCSPGMIANYAPTSLTRASSYARSRLNHLLLVGDTRARRLILGRVSGFITISEALRRLHIERGVFQKLSSAVIPNIVEAPGSFSEDELRVVREDFGLSPGRTVLFAPGKLSWGKGYEVLAAAVPLVCRAIPDVRFVCVGDGPALTFDTPENVLLVPRLPRADLNSLLRIADVAVVPSITFEGFGRVCIESLACGTPVIASDAGGLPEILNGSCAGLVVPRGDHSELAIAIVALLSDADRRHTMGEEGKRMVAERFGASAVARQTVEFFDHILS